jgi:hypothetical protein
MYILFRTILITLTTASIASAALHFDMTGGYSLQSGYQYFAGNPAADTFPWISFNSINNVCASSRLSIDVWKDTYRFGIYGGFMRRFDLVEHRRTGTIITNDTIGNMLSIPLLCFVEGRYKSAFYEFGLGPYLTRFNYMRKDLPEFYMTSFFGFLFGGGYEHTIYKNLAVQVKGELLVCAPVFVVDYLDTILKDEIHGSRYTEYNSNEFQTIIYNAAISIGLRYDFGNNIRIPMEDTGKLIKAIRENDLMGMMRKK